MKALRITVDGGISFILDNIEGVTDTSNPNLSAADVRLFLDEIDKLQANNFQELHLEKNSMRAFVHKVGIENFISESDPDKYEIFAKMHQWGPAVHHG